MNSDQKQHPEPSTNNPSGRAYNLSVGVVLVITLFGVLFLWHLLSQNQAAITELEAKIESSILEEKAEQEPFTRDLG